MGRFWPRGPGARRADWRSSWRGRLVLAIGRVAGRLLGPRRRPVLHRQHSPRAPPPIRPTRRAGTGRVQRRGCGGGFISRRSSRAALHRYVQPARPDVDGGAARARRPGHTAGGGGVRSGRERVSLGTAGMHRPTCCHAGRLIRRKAGLHLHGGGGGLRAPPPPPPPGPHASPSAVPAANARPVRAPWSGGRKALTRRRWP
mmetsp:Transcript_8123/g.26789  ORF Transcript_8123/g.26789 Transcript_8123/m.26789 type:complete len:201 (-) Transcript_8123:1026-1628(-)